MPRQIILNSPSGGVDLNGKNGSDLVRPREFVIDSDKIQTNWNSYRDQQIILQKKESQSSHSSQFKPQIWRNGIVPDEMHLNRLHTPVRQ